MGDILDNTTSDLALDVPACLMKYLGSHHTHVIKDGFMHPVNHPDLNLTIPCCFLAFQRAATAFLAISDR